MKCLIGLAAALILLASTQAEAVTITVRDNTRGEVRVTAEGSLNLAGLGNPVPRYIDFYDDPIVDGPRGWIPAGLPEQIFPGSRVLHADGYRNVFTTPGVSFGPGPMAPWWSLAEGDDFFAIDLQRNEILVTPGYRSGGYFRTSTWYMGAPGFSLATLGLVSGTFSFNLVNGERIDLRIAEAGAIPLPAGLPLAATGIALLAGMSLRNRRRKAGAG